MKKLKLVLAVMMILALLMPATVLAANTTTIYVNTRPVKLDVAPIKLSGDVLAPANNLFDALKISYKINSKDNSVTATYNNKTVWIQANNLKMKLNGKIVNLKHKPMLTNKKILIPVRFVSDLLGIAAIEQGQWSKEGQYRVDIYSVKSNIGFSQIKYCFISDVTSDGLNRIQQNSNQKYGFINRSGIEAIKPIYDDATDFRDGIAFVKRNGKWGMINTSGKEVVAPAFEDVRYYSKGLVAVCKNNLWGYFDTIDKKMVVSPQFTNATAFYGDYAIVTKTGSDAQSVWKVMNRSGKIMDGTTLTGLNSLPQVTLFPDNTCYIRADAGNGFDGYMLSANGCFPVHNINYLAPDKYTTAYDYNTYVINSKNETLYTASLTSEVRDRYYISDEFVDLGFILVYGQYDSYYGGGLYNYYELFTLDFQSTGVSGKDIDSIGENMIMVTTDKAFQIFDSKLNKQFGFPNDGSFQLVNDNSSTYETYVDGMAVLRDQNSSVYKAIDKKGKVQFELKCKNMRSIGEQRFYATVVDEWNNERGVILDNKGNVISQGNITNCTGFSKGIVFIESDKYRGYIDKTGKHIIDIPVSYGKPNMNLRKEIRDNYDLFAFNVVCNKYGYSYQVIVDKSKRTLIPVAFFKLEMNDQGSIIVRNDWNNAGYMYIK